MSFNPTDSVTGICLSGGGTKAIAHAGVLKCLEEMDITPKVLSGTSAGAIVAALHALGKSPEEILGFFQSIYLFKWHHFTYKKPGLIDTAAFKKYFTDVFGERTLDQLPAKVFVTATDMVHGQLKVFHDKKIVDALLASCAFPGIFSPYELQDCYYSDGGILNHFPADIINGRCEFLIGVYVSPLQDITKKNLNSIKSVTMRALDLLIARNPYQKFSLCDLVIKPKKLAEYGTFETNKKRMEEIFTIGYESALAALRLT